ncbi:hypothetical protein CEXT_372491 [Caerostris extrusa]|uniref:Uncharacterized protein n=1 Tax=Caerostris extrusa TaxID=172846 RepID=A0AAV4VL68_CAEEX|nr:hypothetical protein CEXT_372491 [Caerostris extrusa]
MFPKLTLLKVSKASSILSSYYIPTVEASFPIENECLSLVHTASTVPLPYEISKVDNTFETYVMEPVTLFDTRGEGRHLLGVIVFKNHTKEMSSEENIKDLLRLEEFLTNEPMQNFVKRVFS